MKTEVLRMDGSDQDLSKLRYAARLLQAGALVAFPTETVYGLGADARNPESLTELSKVKQRADNKPYSLLVPSVRAAEAACGGLSHVAKKLARIYWPGPLTLVVRKRGGGTVGMRLPEHPVTRSLLSQCGFPLATPSANISGTREPRTAEHVREQLDGEISLILDGGPAKQGRPSAVVKVDNERLEIKRAGSIPNAEILEAARPTILFVCTGNTCRSPMAAGFCQLGLTETPKGPLQQDNAGLPFRVLSAGTNAVDGDPADRLANEAMREVSVDISRHRTRSLTPGLLETADWVFTMTRAHRESILMLMPTCADRVQLLSNRNDDIPDPVSSSLEQYRRVRDRIASCLRDVVRLVGGT